MQMNLIELFLLLIGVFLSALWVTSRFRHSDVALKTLDIPNDRSSHIVATPRGGGVAIVLATVTGLVILGGVGALRWELVAGMVGGGMLVAIIGFADDYGDIAPRWRLLGHFVAALWVVTWLHGLPALRMLGFVADLGWV